METGYLYSWNKNRYEKIAARTLPKKETLGETIVEGGFLLPNHYGENRMFGYGGVADAQGNYVSASEMNTYAKYVRTPVPEEIQICFGPTYDFAPEQVVDSIDGEVVYLGYLNNHWGHLLIDYSVRLYYFLEKDRPELKYAYVVDENSSFQMIANVARFFELLGIRDRLLLVNHITKCDRIILPEPSYITNGYYSDAHLRVFDTIAEKVDCSAYPTYNKVYYARKNVQKAQGSEVGEAEVVRLFEQNGFTVISPETLSLDEQIAIIRNTDVLAGLSGSLAHNLLFAAPGQQMIVLNKTHNVNMAQFDVDFIKQTKTLYIDAYLAKFPVNNGMGPFFVVVSDELLRYAADHEFSYDAAELVNDRILTENARTHEKTYRSKYIADLCLRYEKDPAYFDYFAPELLVEYASKTYHLIEPVTGAEKMRHFKERVVRHLKQ